MNNFLDMIKYLSKNRDENLSVGKMYIQKNVKDDVRLNKIAYYMSRIEINEARKYIYPF